MPSTKILAGHGPRGMRGMARRKAQTYGSVSVAGTRRAPLGAPHALKQRSGSASKNAHLQRSRSACYLRHLSAPGPASSTESGLTSGSASSASSWQGLLVVPGGAPVPPEWLVSETSPAGRRTPSRNHERLMMRPSSERGSRRIEWFRSPGITYLRRSLALSATS